MIGQTLGRGARARVRERGGERFERDCAGDGAAGAGGGSGDGSEGYLGCSAICCFIRCCGRCCRNCWGRTSAMPQTPVEHHHRPGRPGGCNALHLRLILGQLRPQVAPRHQPRAAVLFRVILQHPGRIDHHPNRQRARRIPLVRVQRHRLPARRGDVGGETRQGTVRLVCAVNSSGRRHPPQPRMRLLVVIPAGDDAKLLFVDLVHEPVLGVDAPRPAPLQLMA